MPRLEPRAFSCKIQLVFFVCFFTPKFLHKSIFRSYKFSPRKFNILYFYIFILLYYIVHLCDSDFREAISLLKKF